MFIYVHMYIYIYLSRGDTTTTPDLHPGGGQPPPPHLHIGLLGTPAALTPVGPSRYPNHGGSSTGDPGTSLTLSFFSSLCENLHLQRWGKPQGVSFSQKYMLSFFGYISNLIYIYIYIYTQRSPPWLLHQFSGRPRSIRFMNSPQLVQK